MLMLSNQPDSGVRRLCWRRPIFPGGFPPSIFGTSELNFRVRNGNGWTLTVNNTNYISAAGSPVTFYLKAFALFAWYTFRDSNPGHPD